MFKNLDVSDYPNLSGKQLASMIQPYYRHLNKAIRFQEFNGSFVLLRLKTLSLETKSFK